MESLLKLGVSESRGQTLVSQWITPILVVVSAALVRPSHSDASERHAFSIASTFVFYEGTCALCHGMFVPIATRSLVPFC